MTRPAQAPAPVGRLAGLARVAPAALVGLAVAAYLAETWGVRPHADDAYIFYRYARNLVDGAGLVYNAGEYVDGNTSFLWPLLLAAGLRLGLDVKLVAHGLGVAGGVGALVASFVYAASGLPAERRWVAALAPWVLLSAGSFLVWSTAGMETPLFVATATAALAAEARRRSGWMWLALGAATLTRPEGLLLAALAAVGRAASGGLREPAFRAGAASYVVLIAVVTGFRLWYFGAPLPNTFYAKVGGVDANFGWFDVFTFAVVGWGLLAPAFAAAFLDRRWWPGGAFVLAVLAFDVRVGGDQLGHHRFLLPMLPALVALSLRGALLAWDRRPALGFALGGLVAGATLCALFAGAAPLLFVLLSLGWWGWIATRAGELTGVAITLLALYVATGVAWWRRALWLLPATLAALALVAAGAIALWFPGGLSEFAAVALPPARTRLYTKNMDSLARFERGGRRRAEILVARGDPDALVASGAIGVLGYHSMLPVLDIYGLVDATIARSRARGRGDGIPFPGHARSDADYVMGREPDYIVIPRRSDAAFFATRAQTDLWAHPDLDAHYVWDRELAAYRRRAADEAPAE